MVGLEEYSHLWLIWKFSENEAAGWSPMVYPPRLGGRTHVGVFATRSPFRPNPIGLSSVKLDQIEMREGVGPVLHISGADLLDGTDLEKLDPAKDDNVGLVVLSTEADKPGDAVNRDTLELVKELDHPIYVLTEEEEDSEASEEGESSREEVRERAKEQVLDWMKEYGKQLDVILCADDMQALGAWDAVSEEKRLVGHDVLIMGFDSNRESLEEVASGNIRSTFFNDFMEQSSNASNAVLAFLKGIAVEPVKTSEYVSVTVDNAQEILDMSVTVQESEAEQDSEETTEE